MRHTHIEFAMFSPEVVRQVKGVNEVCPIGKGIVKVDDSSKYHDKGLKNMRSLGEDVIIKGLVIEIGTALQ